MLLTQLLATAFVIVGCCITIYICVVNCFCIARGVEVDEDKLMDKVYTGVGVMGFIFMLMLFSLICELTLHLIS